MVAIDPLLTSTFANASRSNSGMLVHSSLYLPINQNSMAKPRRNKKVLALVQAKWLKHVALSWNLPVHWTLSDDGETVKRQNYFGEPPKRPTRREEVYKHDGNWWLYATKGKGDKERSTAKEIVPIQSSTSFTLYPTRSRKS